MSSHIAYALEHLKTDNAAWDLRAKALLAVAYCTMARRAELVAIRVEDLSFNAQSGDGVALIRNTKAGREESRYLSGDAVAQLRARTTTAQIESGAVFRRFESNGQIGNRSIVSQEVARIIQRVGQLLNAERSTTELAKGSPGGTLDAYWGGP